MGDRVESRVLALGGVAVVGMLAAWATLVPDPPAPMAVPTAAELAGLEPYLTPVAMDAGQVTVPPPVAVDGDPFSRPLAVGPEPSPGQPGIETAARWAVTAILIAGDRRVAIVNDKLVRPGDRLEGGARIGAVERDHVVLITPDGERRRLELER